ncbi:hypothetical protein [Phenylobacterium sp. LjRoot225]|uniref:hypothetical protein n=1 Tax=Phenylobacterium sp. LjRoot225 TaxID=3342285 RepID=UPI003F50819B
MMENIVRAPTAPRLAPVRVNDAWRVLWVSLALFIAALAIRLLLAEQQPVWTDELYHLLAAESLSQGRGLDVYEGEYTRDPLFTWIVSLLSPYFTWNLLLPRLPAAIAGALQVSIVFAWLRYRSDWIAALAAALFLCFAEMAVQQSAYVRFYSLHALFFWLAAASAYDLFDGAGRGKPILIGAIGVVGAAVSLHLQPTTLFGLGAIALWAAWMLLRADPSKRTQTLLISVGVLGVIGAALLALARPDLVARAIYEYTHTEQWNRKASQDLLYYVKYLIKQYPVISLLSVPALTLSYREKPSLTALCVFIIAISGAALSVAGMKSARYFLFALPFVFTIFGLGLSAAWRLFVDRLPPAADEAKRRLWLALAGVAVVAVLALNPGFVTTMRWSLDGLQRALSARSLLFSAASDKPWESQRAEAAAALAGRSVILTTEEFRTLRYLGAFDLALVPMNKGENGKKDFIVDLRTGRPHISTPQNIQAIYNCYPTGALILAADGWPATFELNAGIQAFLDRHARHQAFAAKGVPVQLHVVTWDHPPAPPTAACEALKRYIGKNHRPASETIDRIAAEPGGGRIALPH